MKKLLQKLFAFWQRRNVSRPNVFRPKRATHRKGLAAGFTLIELLVAALIASLLVSILLSFLVGVLDSDRKETAKSNAQEELQAAISYISDDLQEAIYIYGSESLAGINSQLPHTDTGATSQCNTTNCTPVLVFWKRFTYSPNSQAKYTTASTAADPLVKLGCMPYLTQTAAGCGSGTTATAFGRDTYTYSLVAYYLKNDDPLITGNSGSTWSNTARILRWEIKDGYVAYCSTGGTISATNSACPTPSKQTLRGVTLAGSASNNTAISPAITDTTNYFIVPSKGFNRPDFSSAGTLSTLSAAWKKFDNFDFFPNPFTTLVDFMDDTDYAAAQGGNVAAAGTGTSATAASAIKIPIGTNTTIANVTSPVNLDCDDPSVGVGNPNPASAANPSGSVTQRVPEDFTSTVFNPSKLSSFYACVTPESVTARIYLRGNAIARLGTPPVPRANRPPTISNSTFFPNADVRSFGRSAIGLKKK